MHFSRRLIKHLRMNDKRCLSVIFLIICLSIGACHAVINSDASNHPSISADDATKQQQHQHQIRGSSQEVFSSNDETTSDQVSFQYEPSAFLVGKSQPSSTSTSSTTTTTTTSKPLIPNEFSSITTSKRPSIEQQHEVARNYLVAPPATTTATVMAAAGGRSGRMLDLDVLMGDKSVRERSQGSVRQSRYLHQQQTMDVGNKKLKIQGYIPIVSIKDDDSSSQDDEPTNYQPTSQHQKRLLQQQQQQLHQHQHQQPNLNPNDLPYAQSSIGHASFGVQRYLQPQISNEPPQFTLNSGDINTNQQQSGPMKSGASVVDTLKRPLKRLASLTAGSTISQESNQGLIKGQDCLCVPFYMCKNGFVSESSVSRAQIHQMMIAQQFQQQRSPQQQQAFSIATSPEDSTPPPVSSLVDQKQAQYADSIVPVDERSMERDLISALNSSPSPNNDDATSNKTTPTSTSLSSQSANDSEQLYSSIQQMTSSSSNASSSDNQSDQAAGKQQGASEDFSQEILGRMLGLRAPSRMSAPSSSGPGGCGVLRTCCAIPPHLLASLSGDQNQQKEQQHQQQQQQMLMKQQHQQQSQALMQQRFTQLPKTNQVQLQQQQSGYGLPVNTGAAMAAAAAAGATIGGSMIHQHLNGLSAPMQMLGQEAQASPLAHRSTQFANQQQQQRPQYQMQPVQPAHNLAMMGSQVVASQPPAWQQQQQLIKQNNNNALMRQQVSPLRSTLVGNNRKILEGRCGLRQSAGINGRVQNLQYGENSADFGEYPAQAAILKKLSGSDSLFVCGGTLISQYWIATAAHCIKKHTQSELKVRLGEWDVHRDDEFYPFVEKDIRDVVIHPEFVSGNLINDIALLRLDSPVDPSLPHVNPACLPALDETFARQKCWVTGWGKDSFGQKGSFQSVLQEVELPVGEHSDCEAALRQTRLGPHYRLHPGFICAGGEGGRDACEGDGGSGLYCLQADGLIKVAGLVSWGIGCGQAGVPGVYVNLAHYRGWIENIIAIDEDIYSPYANTLGAGNLISERSNEAASNKTQIVAQDNNNSTMSPQSS